MAEETALARNPNEQTKALLDVVQERVRQVRQEGYDPSHDDMATRGQLALAASCYAISSVGSSPSAQAVKALWPWVEEYWKPTTSRRNFVKAGALILAEIERLDRAEALASEVHK